MHLIYFQTHGCSNNQSESEIMKGLLKKAGFRITDSCMNADIVVLNICTVKGEFKAMREIRKTLLENPSRKIIIAGCITHALISEIREVTEDASLINTHNITKIVEVVEEALHGNVIGAVSFDTEKKINLPRVRKNPVIGIIPILSGCDGECSYCSVRLIKGSLQSYSKEDVVSEVISSLEAGCKEIWITSQDNSSYGKEKSSKSSLPELMKEIISIPKDFMVRIGMMNVNNLKPILSEMLDIYKSPKVFKFLHLPIQSGSDRILSMMKRRYTFAEFKEVIDRFKAEIPKITISTDIIVGYPGETAEDFGGSISAIQEIKPDCLNISRYIAREGTDAFKDTNTIQDDEVKRRSRILTTIFQNISNMNNEKWIGWEGSVLIDESGKEGSFVARNPSYKQVVLTGKYLLGTRLKVRIVGNTIFDLRGQEISN